MRLCSAADFLFLGLDFAEHGQHRSQDTKIIRFRASYGVDLTTCSLTYEALQTEFKGTTPLPGAKVEHLLLTLNWLKCYSTEACLASSWSTVSSDEKTIQGIVEDYSEAIALLHVQKFIFPGDQGADWDEVLIVTVDGTHCCIQEPRKFPSSNWFLQKFNGAGLVYEVAIGIFRNQVCWINGPFPASQSDNKVFSKNDGLKSKIPNGKRVIADGNYHTQQNANVVSGQNEHDSTELKNLKKRALASQETFNSCLKNFLILDTAFRHGLQKHKACFFSVAVLQQYEMENGRPLFQA